MRAWTWLALVALVVCGLASAPSAQEEVKLDTRLFKKDRVWLVKRTDRNADKGKETTYMQYKVKSVTAEVAEVEQTQLDEKKKAIAKSAFTVKVKLDPDFYWFKIPEGAEIKDDETVTVEAGTFDCFVYTFAGATLYKSKKYPGLTVKGKSTVPEELVEFKTFKDDGVAAEEQRAAPKADFSLYKKKGRVWELTGKDSYKGEFVERYEVLQADDSTAKVQYTLRDKAGKAIGNQQDWTNSLKFDEAHKAWISPHDTGKYEKDETISVPAGTFDTAVYFRPTSEKWSATRWWYSKTLPGLTVKKEYDGGSCELTKLTLFKGEKTSAVGPAVPDPSVKGPDKADRKAQNNSDLWKEGRSWKVKRTLSSGDGQKGVVFLGTTIKAINGDQATVTYESIDEKGVATTPAKEGQIAIQSWCKDAHDAVFGGAAPTEETIVVAGQKWLCWKVVSDGKNGMAIDRRWHSQALSGLRIKLERGKDKTVSHREELSEIKLFEGESGRLDKKPNSAPIEEEPQTPADWSLFKKKGRKWTSKSSSKYSTTFSTYEILTVGKDHCEYKVATLDKDKKPIVAPSNLKLEFTNENAALWVKPLSSYKKLREEKLKAAGVEWDCIVYEGSLLKNQTQTLWMSKKYPGLYVKIVTNTDGSESVDELIEFKD